MVLTREPLALRTFAQAPLFAGLREADLAELAAHFHARRFAHDETLFHEGHPAHVYFLLAEGRVKIIQTSPEGADVILHLLGPGELVGALPNLDEGTYPGSAIALDDVLALAISPADFEALLEQHPRIAINLLHFAAGKLRSVHHRLPRTHHGARRASPGPHALPPGSANRPAGGGRCPAGCPLTRQALAELSGTSLFTVSRTLKEWERQGWLLAGRERVVIVNTHALATKADDLPLPAAPPDASIPHT